MDQCMKFKDFSYRPNRLIQNEIKHDRNFIVKHLYIFFYNK